MSGRGMSGRGSKPSPDGQADSSGSRQADGSPEWACGEAEEPVGGSGASWGPLLAQDLPVHLESRWPHTLPESTREAAQGAPAARFHSARVNRAQARVHCCGASLSVIIPVHNQLAATQLCLHSLARSLREAHCEVILVDNASSDGTPEMLRELARLNPCCRVISNPHNRGFAPAVNQGLEASRGDILVILNNDTLLPPGWWEALFRALRDPAVGLAGPCTNKSGNEAEIAVDYRTYGEFLRFARRRRALWSGESDLIALPNRSGSLGSGLAAASPAVAADAAEGARQGQSARGHSEDSGPSASELGLLLDLPMLSMFCLAMRREVYQRIGPLDQRFQVGMFEDDDYSRRARQLGLRTVCVEDAFVHHFGQATFSSTGGSGDYQRLMEANRRRYEEKWGGPWRPHGRREDVEYRRLRHEIARQVAQALPADAALLAAAKGDERLLEMIGRRSRHLPSGPDGTYAGHHPADSEEIIEALRRGRRDGYAYFLLTSSTLWWLEHYQGLSGYLASSGGLVNDGGDRFKLFRFDPSSDDASNGGIRPPTKKAPGRVRR